MHKKRTTHVMLNLFQHLSLPLCKRGMKGDLRKMYFIYKISPVPSLPKRGIEFESLGERLLQGPSCVAAGLPASGSAEGDQGFSPRGIENKKIPQTKVCDYEEYFRVFNS